MVSSLIQIGKIVGVHGIKGLVEIKPFLTNPADFAHLKPITNKTGKTFDISIQGQKRDILLAQITGINNRTMAETLKGTDLFAPKSALPKPDLNEFYYSDLIGLLALKDGSKFGTVTAVNNYGAGDILTIQKTDGETVDLIFQSATFPNIDLDKKTIDVVLPRGLKGDSDEN